MTEPIITVSGLRGIVGETLTPEVAARYAIAFAAEAPPGEILVGRDSRPSGFMLASAVHVGLQAVGRTTIDAGIVATPTAGVLLRRHKAAGAVQITASHNPPPYNGLKLFSAEGRVISAGPGQKVLERYREGQPKWATHDRIGEFHRCDDTITDHLRAVLETVDADRIRGRRFRVVLDSNHGAGGILGRRLLDELGCRVMLLGEQPNGRFAHPAEPTAENLAGVLISVVEHEAEIGFCQDPDADRLAVIDQSGRYLGEEYTLAMCVEHVLRQLTQGGQSHFRGERADPKRDGGSAAKIGTVPEIVANCASSRMSQNIAERYGVPYFRSAVGEANVADAMIAHGAVFGGEGNGGPIDPRVGYVRDSFVGMALLLDAMAAREMPIGQLADELPRYEIVKTKISLPPEKLPDALDALEKHFSDAAADRLDGLRLDWPDRWLLVRGSNTEPIVRAIAEAPTATEASRLCEVAARIIG
ncbi:MAG: phosphoglucosamine mutase [Pirellulales bacterium]|nr:phosphoglucosamine mutase [Pirellulales bacterium]